MSENILPIGSVILLKNGNKKLIVTGIKPVLLEEPDKIFDYIGVLYPEGYLGNEGNYLFNHENIADVIFRGYENPEWKEFVELLKNNYQE